MYSCPWPNTFKKSFKISWTPSCNSNQLEVTLFAINLPISYWYTGLYRVSMLHVPPPGQRGDKNLSSSSSNNKKLKVKIEKKMQTLMKARQTQDHYVFFLPKHGDIKRTTVMRRRLNPRHQRKDIYYLLLLACLRSEQVKAVKILLLSTFYVLCISSWPPN